MRVTHAGNESNNASRIAVAGEQDVSRGGAELAEKATHIERAVFREPAFPLRLKSSAVRYLFFSAASASPRESFLFGAIRSCADHFAVGA